MAKKPARKNNQSNFRLSDECKEGLEMMVDTGLSPNKTQAIERAVREFIEKALEEY